MTIMLSEIVIGVILAVAGMGALWLALVVLSRRYGITTTFRVQRDDKITKRGPCDRCVWYCPCCQECSADECDPIDYQALLDDGEVKHLNTFSAYDVEGADVTVYGNHRRYGN